MAKHMHTAHSTPHIITQISEITYSKGYTLQFTQTQNTHKQKNHNTQPVNPPSRSKKTFSPSRNLLLSCCESGHLLLRQRSAVAVLLSCCCRVASSHLLLSPRSAAAVLRPRSAAAVLRPRSAATVLRPAIARKLLRVQPCASCCCTPTDLLPKTQPPICCSKAQAPTRPEFLP